MDYYYSPTTRGFYHSEIHGDSMPDDAIALNDEQYTALLDGQAEGKAIMPPDAEHGMLWLQDAPPPTVEDVAKAKLAEIMAAYDAAFAPIEAVYPAKERETWAIQLAEAEAWLADNTAPTPMLSVLIAARGMGENVADFAEKVMGNNAQYRLLAGYLTGQQQRMYRDVTSMAATPDITAAEIMAYPVAFELPDGLSYGG